jgi:hypothetical protein
MHLRKGTPELNISSQLRGDATENAAGHLHGSFISSGYIIVRGGLARSHVTLRQLRSKVMTANWKSEQMQSKGENRFK